MRKKIGLALAGVMVLAVVVGIAWAQSVPQLINYQGKLTNNLGQPLADGTTVDLTLKFYGVQSGQTPLYLTVLQEDVVVTGGLYNVLIGSGAITAGDEDSLAELFQKHADVWMGVQVDADEEMTPRARVSSVPFALHSISTDAAFLGAFIAEPDYDDDGYPKNNQETSNFVLSDLQGGWMVHDVVSGDDTLNWVGWMHFRLDIDASGLGTCSQFSDSDGDTTCPMPPMPFSISPEGEVTPSSASTWHGIMTLDRNLITATMTDGGGGFASINMTRLTERPLDCNDGNSLIHPGATENCSDGVDNDCDGLIDANDPDC